jgi:hypothetical protein
LTAEIGRLRRNEIIYDIRVFALSKGSGKDHWLPIDWEKAETAASASGEVHDSSAATAVTPTRTRRNGDAAVPKEIMAEEKPYVKQNSGRDADALRRFFGRGSPRPRAIRAKKRELASASSLFLANDCYFNIIAAIVIFRNVVKSNRSHSLRLIRCCISIIIIITFGI